MDFLSISRLRDADPGTQTRRHFLFTHRCLSVCCQRRCVDRQVFEFYIHIILNLIILNWANLDFKSHIDGGKNGKSVKECSSDHFQ